MDILGVRVDDVTYNVALQRCVANAERGGRHLVVTPNPELIMLARRDPAFREILNRSDLAIPDGGGLLLAARLWGQPLREQVRGTDLCYGLAAAAAQRGLRLFLLGGAPGVAAAAGDALQRRYPGLPIAGTFAGDGSARGDAETVAAIRRAGRCDLLFVAYGAPKQERWMARNLERIDAGVAIGVGGVLDFMSGRVRRAPALVRGAGLDWLFRLLQQPRRLRRQATTIPPFVVLVLAEAAARRRDQAGRRELLPRKRT